MKLRSLDKSEKFMVGCGSTAIFGLIFGWVIFPKVLSLMLKKQMTLLKGTDNRDMWTVIPFPLDFKVYFFNYSNPDEVMNGAKPILTEIGPYYFEEWKTKVNLEDFEEEDAISYYRQDMYLFNKKKSAPGLTGGETIVMPHLLIIGIIDNVVKERPEFMKLVKKAIDGVFEAPKNIFGTFKAMDLMFNGIPIACNTTDFAPKALCTALKKEKNVMKSNGNLYFSLFGLKNNTVEETKFKVLRGKKNIMDVGRVVEWNESTSMHIWGGSPCNDFIGTDSTVFPPFLTEKDDLDSFTVDICRSLPAKYERKSSYAGIPANRYVADLGDLPNEPENHCFCTAPDKCPKKGLMDVSKCMGAPVVVSLPHYLNVDPELQQSVIGMRPDFEKHGILIDFEPISGTPLQAKKRIQFNIVVPHVDKNDLFQNFDDTILPMMWVEEGLALNKTFVDMLKNQLFIVLRLVTVFKWCLVVFGSIGTAAAVIVNNRNRLSKFTISPADANKTIRVSTIQNTLASTRE